MLRRFLVLAVLSGLFTSGMLTTDGAQAGTVVHPTAVQTFDGLRSQGATVPGAAGGSAQVVSAPARTPMAFDMVGFRSAADVRFRTSADGRSWSAWTMSEAPSPDDGPDPASAEATAAVAHPLTEPVWVDEARWLQVQVTQGRPEDLSVELLDSSGLSRSVPERAADAITTAWRNGGLPSASAADPDDFRPDIVSRDEWGADESLRRNDPSYASRVRYAVVHHTAGSNTYSRGDAPSVVRGIYAYHTRSNGWNDVGYNMLVDRYGTIYEGRAGGLEYAVQGAHASGHNSGSFGIAVMGEFSAQMPPPAAVYAVEDALAWKAWLNDFDPTGTVTVDGRKIPTVVGHRDVGATACPGNAFYGLLKNMRTDVEALVADAPEAPDLPSPPEDDDEDGDGDGDDGDDDDRDRDPADLASAPDVHRDNIRWLVAQGISRGCGDGDNYCPSQAVSRAQMAAFLRRAMDLDQVDGNRFDDVSGAHTEDVNTIAEEGVTKGCSADGRLFCPDDAISRAQMATFLVRALRLEAAPSADFDDVAPGAVHASSIDALFAAGITSGCDDDRYCPGASVTRAEMASFLRRAADNGL